MIKKKQNLDRILLRITIISDRFNILGKKKKKRRPLTIKQPQTFGFNYLHKNILLIYIIILRKRYSKVGSIQKESEKKSIFIAVKNAQLDCKIIVPLEHHLT